MKIEIMEGVREAVIIYVVKDEKKLFSTTFDWKDGYAVLRSMEVPRSWRGAVTVSEVRRIIKAVNDTAIILGRTKPGAYPSLEGYDCTETLLETTRMGKLYRQAKMARRAKLKLASASYARLMRDRYATELPTYQKEFEASLKG